MYIIKKARFLILFCILSLSLQQACRFKSDKEISGPVKVQVIHYDESCTCYKPQIVEIKTLTNLYQVKGSAGAFYYGFKVDTNHTEKDPYYADIIGKYNNSKPVRAYFDKIDGVYYPSDFDSTRLISAYYNFEKVKDFFDNAGLDQGDQSDLKIFYESYFDPSSENKYDNASFRGFKYNDTIYTFFNFRPFNLMQDLPFEMNLGIVAHEYSHYIFYKHIFAPDNKFSITDERSENLDFYYISKFMSPFNEGIADLFAGLVTNDPNFIKYSIPKLENDRDLRSQQPIDDITAAFKILLKNKDKKLDTNNIAVKYLREALYSNPNFMGNIIAASIWKATKSESRVKIIKTLVLWMKTFKNRFSIFQNIISKYKLKASYFINKDISAKGEVWCEMFRKMINFHISMFESFLSVLHDKDLRRDISIEFNSAFEGL